MTEMQDCLINLIKKNHHKARALGDKKLLVSKDVKEKGRIMVKSDIIEAEVSAVLDWIRSPL